MVDKAVILIPNDQPTKLTDPRDRAFDFPASSISSQLSTVLSGLSLATSSVGANQVPALLPQARSQFVTVVGSVSNQWRGRFPGRDGFEDPFDQRDLSRRSTFGPACKWNSLAIPHHHPLGSLASLGFSDAVPPFFAGEKLPSTKTSSQSSRTCSSSWSRKECQISIRTPAVSHSTIRRQQVLGEGKRPSGKSLQRAPLLSTHSIPSRQARSSAGGRPPRGDLGRTGISGRIRSHCRSVSKTSCLLAITAACVGAVIP